jgi:SAM-dependent methyltransferase
MAEGESDRLAGVGFMDPEQSFRYARVHASDRCRSRRFCTYRIQNLGASMQDRVRDQYEQYPYPKRSLEEDVALLKSFSPLESLAVVSHNGFGGRLDRRRPLRILVAGGGTGDATLLLGRDLAERRVGGEIVYVDLSSASMQIAKHRAERAGLTNIRFVRGSYLELDAMGLGGFDYINCSGSLHHLDNPNEGARALSLALSDDGVLGAMVYGKYGRTGVYAAQQLLSTLAGDLSLADQLPIARGVLSQLPASNWLNKNSGLRFGNHLSDAEIVDRFLHVQDRAYTITEVQKLMAQASLRMVDVVPSLLYRPEDYLADPNARSRMSALSQVQRWQLAEWLTGTLSRHSWFAVRTSNPVKPMVLCETAVPQFLGGTGGDLARQIRSTGQIDLQIGNLRIRRPFDLPPPLFDALTLVDGKRTLGKIHRRVKPRLPWDVFVGAFGAIYRYYGGASNLVLSAGEPKLSADT